VCCGDGRGVLGVVFQELHVVVVEGAGFVHVGLIMTARRCGAASGS